MRYFLAVILFALGIWAVKTYPLDKDPNPWKHGREERRHSNPADASMAEIITNVMDSNWKHILPMFGFSGGIFLLGSRMFLTVQGWKNNWRAAEMGAINLAPLGLFVWFLIWLGATGFLVLSIASLLTP
jgi:hypothetical protein